MSADDGESQYTRFVSLASGTTLFAATGPSVAAPKRNDVQQGTKYQIRVDGTGSVSAAGQVEVSMWPDGPWLPAGTMTASGTTQASDSVDVAARWIYHRFNLTALSAGATAQCTGAGFGE